VMCILESSSPSADGTLVQLDKRLHDNVSHEEIPRRSDHPPFIASFVGCAVLNRSSRHSVNQCSLCRVLAMGTLCRISIDQHFSWQMPLGD